MVDFRILLIAAVKKNVELFTKVTKRTYYYRLLPNKFFMEELLTLVRRI